MNKKILVAKYYKDVTSSYDINIWAEEIQWIRENIPELSLWSDVQIIRLGDDDYSQTQERTTFQTPLHKDMFLDYATYISLFDLTPDDVNYYACEDDIKGIYKAFANGEDLIKWKLLTKEGV